MLLLISEKYNILSLECLHMQTILMIQNVQTISILEIEV